MKKTIGWMLMGYPHGLPLWERIYFLGAKLFNQDKEV